MTACPPSNLALGQQLRGLRDHGVLIVGSGNIVHNLRAMRASAAPNQAYDWAMAFDTLVAEQLQRGDTQGLADFRNLGQVAQMAHPTHEHYLPLLYCAGGGGRGRAARVLQHQLPAGGDFDAVCGLGLTGARHRLAKAFGGRRPPLVRVAYADVPPGLRPSSLIPLRHAPQRHRVNRHAQR